MRQVEDATVVATDRPPPAPTSKVDAEPIPSEGDKRAMAKLPKLILPKFSGDVTKFRSFWDSFKSAIDENSDLSTVDKFNYLQSLVRRTSSYVNQFKVCHSLRATTTVRSKYWRNASGEHNISYRPTWTIF